MTVTTLDPHSALILIDLQKGIVASPMAHPIAGVIEQAVALADAFRRRGLPVFLVNVAGRPPGRTEQPRPGAAPAADWADLIPELRQQADDHLITKRTSGAFTETGLEQQLKQRGVTQVVLAGVATSNGVESTARHAYELGFNVTLATDAMTDTSRAAHEHSLTHSFPRLGESGSSAAIIALLPALPAAGR